MSVIKSFSVGNGDMFYIRHNTPNFTIIDCKLSEADKAEIVDELDIQSRDKQIVRFISTHPDDDHICGLPYLQSRMEIRNFYCVENKATKPVWTDDFQAYCEIRDAPKTFHLYRSCSRKWLNVSSKPGDPLQINHAGLHVLWPILDNLEYKKALLQAELGQRANNISIILRYVLEGGAKILWMGDLETQFMESIKNEIAFSEVDILFAPHHGRDRVPSTWLNQMNPQVIVLGEAPSEHLEYYCDRNTITQNSAGDITIDCSDGKVRFYVSDPDYYVDFLEHANIPDGYGGYYLGSMKTK